MLLPFIHHLQILELLLDNMGVNEDLMTDTELLEPVAPNFQHIGNKAPLGLTFNLNILLANKMPM